MKTRILLLLGALLLAFAAGCENEVMEEGVVAKVNGHPILLEQLEAKYDLVHLGWTGGITPSVNRLKQEYGDILSELIIQELVFQVLDEKNIPVSEDEVDEAEAAIRADYPEGVFEQILIEEYIDYGVWRSQLRAYVAQEKFMREILRPRIRLEYQEAEAYYKEHQDEFFLPARVHFLLLMGPSEDMVNEAAMLYQAVGDTEQVLAEHEQISIQDMNMRRDRLPDSWNNALTDLTLGDASQPQATQGGYESLVLLERIPEQVLDPSQAYPLVERILMEQKLHQAFVEWLEQEIADSEILVSTHLLHPDEEDEEEEVVQDYFAEDEPLYDYTEGMGRLFVETDPDNATVRIMNIRPAFEQGMELEEGEYVINVELDGYNRYEETVYVYPEQDSMITVFLEPEDGLADTQTMEDVEGSTDQEGVEIPVDENAAEETPVEQAAEGMGRLYVDTDPADVQIRVLNIAPRFHQGIELVPGEYVVDVQKEGYATQVVNVTVAGEGDTRIQVTLAPEGGEPPADPPPGTEPNDGGTP